ncbi:MAG: tail fiber domain-containing protein [Microscillaceae bacterium]|nr:tail fiber domain-containing protein [Microscillaceae bacterium]
MNLALLCLGLMISCPLTAQQWLGSGISTGSIYRDGNVGIGISTPTRPFQLRGSNTVLQIDRDTKDPGFGVTRYSPGFGQVWKSFFFYTEGNAPNDGRFIIADWGTATSGPSTPRFVIANTGNIGLGGELSPAYPLEINGTATTGIQYDGPGNGFAGTYMNGGLPFYGYKQNDAIQAYHYLDNAQNWRLWLNGADRLGVTTTGNVGIGSSTPTERLDVSGRVRANNATIGPWPYIEGAYAFFGNNALDQTQIENYALIQQNNGRTFLNSPQDLSLLIDNDIHLFINNIGRIGIGTTVPTTQLQVTDTDWQFRLNNTNVGGGSWYIGASDNAWAVGGDKLVISPNATSTNAILTVTETGQVGIGNAAPTTALHVGTNSGDGSRVTFGSLESLEDGGAVELATNSIFRPTFTGIRDLGTPSFTWDDVYYSGSLILSSDLNLKKNIHDIASTSALDKILKLRPVTYQLKQTGNDRLRAGLIAQELRKVIPELVHDPKDYMRESEETGKMVADPQEGYLAVDYVGLIPYLIAAFQEQEQKLTEVQALREEVKQLKAALASIQGANPVQNSSLKAQLYQNTPNPFHRETEIRFHLPDGVGEATLFVYDMQGTQIQKISLTQRGTSSVRLQSGTLKAGMYLYALIADGQEVDTKRMIITE